MENNITFINVTSYAIYFIQLEESQKKNQKKINRLITKLKKHIIKNNKGRSDLSDVFIMEIKNVACLVCANAKLSMATIAVMIENGEDTPFDERMNNETVVPVPDSNTVQNGEHCNIVLHKDDIGFVGEMGNESMPYPFNWDTAKIIPGPLPGLI